jgi:hypothetical protein
VLYKLSDISKLSQPIIETTEISSNLNTTVHPDTGTIHTAENDENQYNILDHTLLNTRVDNGNVTLIIQRYRTIKI